MDKKEKRKADRKRLHEIYLSHDVAAFRAFLKDQAEEHPQLRFMADATGDVLSYLMHTAKSQLIYLGDLWQESRNFCRYRSMWQDSGRAIKDIPLCVTCVHFRDPPAEGDSPCMLLGSTPLDIACRAYKASQK